MIKRVNRFDEFFERLKKEGKVREVTIDPDEMKKFDKHMQEVVRKQKILAARSEESASKVILTC